MIGFYQIKDGMSVCYNQLAKLGKNENVNTEILTKNLQSTWVQNRRYYGICGG